MIQLEPALFSNLGGSIQRTSSLAGGEVRGLPGGVVVGGLQGVGSFSSAIADAQKEARLGRLTTALERIRQLETSYSGIAGRWNSTVMTAISSARTGRDALPLAKLNELKSAQMKMQQMTGPVERAFRDLITALEHAISQEGRKDDQEEKRSEVELPPEFSQRFQIGERIQLQPAEESRVRIVPKFRRATHYAIASDGAAKVARLDKIKDGFLEFHDLSQSTPFKVQLSDLADLIEKGIWELQKTDE